ncbi:MAG TPA: MFS transporter, partial [Terracidiphilus sp.]|nr:MFS transporter [Terracidiphilus sp.]
KAEKTGLSANVREILTAIREMPETMRRLGPVQFCTWMGLFCMWLYFPVAVAHNVFGAEDTRSPLYQAGVEWGGNCFAVYSAVCFIFSFALPGLARRLGRKHTHSLCLLMGALGLMSVVVIHNKWLLLLTMVGVGIAWASTLSMPYAVLAASIPPARTGVYMGIFNFFIVTPEILASLFFGWVMIHLLGNNRIYAIIAGGVFLVIAAVLMQRVRDPQTLSVQDA